MSVHRVVLSWIGKNVEKWVSLIRKEPKSRNTFGEMKAS